MRYNKTEARWITRRELLRDKLPPDDPERLSQSGCIIIIHDRCWPTVRVADHELLEP